LRRSPPGGVILRAVKEMVEHGVLTIAARTGFTRSEIIGLPLHRFMATLRGFLPKEQQ